jgi:plasmid stability protein
MSNLLIHDLGTDLKARLQRDAERHGRSLDEHARVLLAQALGIDAPANDLQNERMPGIEHIELAVDQGPSNDKSLREHSRVEYGDIKARFSFDASTKLLGLFTRYFACDVLDISVRGARIRCRKQLREHEAIHLYFTPVGGEKIAIAGLVIRAVSSGADRFEYGVKFSEVMPQGDLRALICRKVVEQKFGDAATAMRPAIQPGPGSRSSPLG